jgi:4-amino-4-deoxy-L-arabinose transferase-like glycosyltransferase
MFLVNLGLPSLWDKDEGRNATAALEMLKSGDYIVPHFNSELRVDKPALLYWLQAAAYKVFGIHEFSARLPSALASLLTLLLCYELGRSLFGKTTGLLAALIVCTTPFMCGAARFANPDALLQLFIVSIMFCFWQSLPRTPYVNDQRTPRISGGSSTSSISCTNRGGSPLWFVAMGAAAGLAALAKGPVGVVLPGSAIAIYCWWTGQGRNLFRPALFLAAATCLLVALPWYVAVGLETKARFLSGFFLDHNIQRFLAPMENHRGSLVYYPAALLVGTAPWSVFWWLLCRPTKQISEHRFLASWLVVVLLFFSMAATKLPNYVLPAMLPCALLVAHQMIRWCRGEIQLPMWLTYLSLFSIGVIGVIVVVGTMLAAGTIPGLRGRTYPGLERLAPLGLVPIVGAAVACWLMRRGQRVGVVWALAITSIGFSLPLGLWASAVLDDFKAPRALLEHTQAQRTDLPLDIYCWNVAHLPSLNFYARRDLTHCDSADSVLSHLLNPTPAYVILPEQDWEKLKRFVHVPIHELAHHHDMLGNETLVIVSNR